MRKENQRIRTNSENFTPAEGMILIKPDQLEEAKDIKSGIIIPVSEIDRTTYRPCTGIVVCINEGAFGFSIIQKSQRVAWPITDGIDIRFDDGVFILMKETSIIGFLEK